MSKVIEMANLAGSGLSESASRGSLAFGTGIYVATRDTRDCFCTPNSAKGAPSACTLTAIPLKHGIVGQIVYGRSAYRMFGVVVNREVSAASARGDFARCRRAAAWGWSRQREAERAREIQLLRGVGGCQKPGGCQVRLCDPYRSVVTSLSMAKVRRERVVVDVVVGGR